MDKFLITTSWDDGSKFDLKLSKLLLKYKIPATFYIPSNCELSKSQIKELSKNFEIGGHTKSHKTLTELKNSRLKNEILNNKIYLENIINKKISLFCYPRGKYNKDLKQLVGLLGYKYARTTKLFSGVLTDKLLAPTTVHAFSHFYIDWEALAYIFFNFYKKFGGVFHLWGHSWEIEKNNDWEKLERVLKYISKSSKVSQRFTNGGLLRQMEKKKDEYYKNN